VSVLTTRPVFVKFFFHFLSFFLPRPRCRPLVRPFNAPPEFFSRLISRELRSCHPAAFCQVLFSRLDVFFSAPCARSFWPLSRALSMNNPPVSRVRSLLAIPPHFVKFFFRVLPFFSSPPPPASFPLVSRVVCCVVSHQPVFVKFFLPQVPFFSLPASPQARCGTPRGSAPVVRGCPLLPAAPVFLQHIAVPRLAPPPPLFYAVTNISYMRSTFLFMQPQVHAHAFSPAYQRTFRGAIPL